MMTEPDALFCSEEMDQIVMEGVREVLGRDEIAALFEAAGATVPGDGEKLAEEQFAAILAVVEKRHGSLGARGIAMRIGRACFPGFVRSFGSDGGFEDAEYRLLPVRKRARAGLEKLAAIFDCACGLRIVVDTTPDAWIWTINDCRQCSNPQVESAVSHFMLGLLQQYLGWISGGKVFQVEETACQANGDPNCVIRIHRLPLD